MSSELYDEIMAEVEALGLVMTKEADDQAPPTQPAETQQDELAVAADNVLSQLHGILEANGVAAEAAPAQESAEVPMAAEQASPGVSFGGGGTSPVININVGGIPKAASRQINGMQKTASRQINELRLRLVDPTGIRTKHLLGVR